MQAASRQAERRQAACEALPQDVHIIVWAKAPLPVGCIRQRAQLLSDRRLQLASQQEVCRPEQQRRLQERQPQPQRRAHQHAGQHTAEETRLPQAGWRCAGLQAKAAGHAAGWAGTTACHSCTPERPQQHAQLVAGRSPDGPQKTVPPGCENLPNKAAGVAGRWPPALPPPGTPPDRAG